MFFNSCRAKHTSCFGESCYSQEEKLYTTRDATLRLQEADKSSEMRVSGWARAAVAPPSSGPIWMLGASWGLGLGMCPHNN